MIRRIADRLYNSARSLDSGFDSDLSDLEMLQFVARKLIDRVRGVSKFLPNTYVARDVKLSGRRHLSLGRSVSLGQGVRIAALSRNGISLGDHVTVDSGATLRSTGVVRNLGVGIRIGERTSVGFNNLILGQGGVEIGCDCLLGPNVCIVSENHNYSDPQVPIREQGETRVPTRIGNDVWLGASVVVLGGADIGDGAVVAAGSVVRGVVPALSVVAGSPARVIGQRGGV
jgi:acetyltransferase-like isoleucine patch superfamily enzyme